MHNIVIIFIALSLLCGCAINEPPSRTAFQTGHVYYQCRKCQSLDGGNYVKKNTESFRTKEGLHCEHDWQRISKQAFEEHQKLPHLYPYVGDKLLITK